MKHQSIQKTMDYFLTRYPSKIILNDHWEDDDEAVGLSNAEEDKLVYISIGEVADTFFLSLEKLTPAEEVPYEEAGDYNNIDKLELEMRIITFFKTVDVEDDGLNFDPEEN